MAKKAKAQEQSAKGENLTTQSSSGCFRLENAELANMLTGTARVLNDIVTRQMVDVMNGTVEPPNLQPDTSLTVLNKLAEAFDTGKGLRSVKAEVDRLTMAQEERMTLVRSLMAQHGLMRMTRLMTARDRLERFMMSATERADLTPAEALLFLKLIQQDMVDLKETLEPAVIKDSGGLVDKADYAQKATVAGAMAKYDKTSPQGREIIRKVIHGLLKKASTKSGQPPGPSGPGRLDEGLE